MRDYASLYDRLLSDLDLQAADAAVGYYSDNSVDFVARRSLATSFYKKLCPEGNSVGADENALKKFEAINNSIPTGPFEFGPVDELESHFWDYFRDEMLSGLDNDSRGNGFTVDFIREHMGVGPGASQLADSSSMISKLLKSRMSYTTDAVLMLYRSALSHAGTWAEAEMLRNQEYGVERVEGGKLFFAPKNAEISRTCCTEATANMLIQKAVGAFFEERTAGHFGISLSEQPDLNRELACIGSKDGNWDSPSGEDYCTIDSVSASDSIRTSLIEATVKNKLLKFAMMVSRSEYAVLPDGRRVALNMISTMGNGFTFPLQTYIFASAVKACYALMGIPYRRPDGKKNFGVFGDDIIVVRKCYDFVVRMLTKLGFTVNKEKSYSAGPFRESCGHDYFKGRNVRGVYIVSLESPGDIYSAINRLHRWSAYHGRMLPRTIALLKDWSRDMRVPPSESDDAGVHVPFNLTRPSLTGAYWFKYRCLKRRVRKIEIEEPAEDNPGTFDLAFGCGFLSGVYRRRDVCLTTEGESWWNTDLTVKVSLRDPIGARPRYQIATKSIAWWDYLPDTTKAEVSLDDGPWRIGSDPDSYNRWGAVVANAYPPVGGAS